MDKKQYNNIIDHSINFDVTDKNDSLQIAKTVFNNMGVAFPQGDMKEVYDTISSNDYMGWRECTLEQAQESANSGKATIGISEDKVVVISAKDDEQPVTQTDGVMSSDAVTPVESASGMQYYAYTAGGTSENTPAPYRTEVRIQKDRTTGMTTVYFVVTGKTWYCIETDLINGDSQSPEYQKWNIRSNYNYFKYYYEGINPGDIDDRPKTYTDEELKLLYAINPYGVAAYVNRYSDVYHNLTDALNYKDRIFRVLFNRNPRYFKRYREDEWMQVSTYTDRTIVVSEAETLFGVHVVYDEFTAFNIVAAVINIVCCFIPRVGTVLSVAKIFYNIFIKDEQTVLNEISSLAIDKSVDDLYKNKQITWFDALSACISFADLLSSINTDFNYYLKPLEYCANDDNYIVYIKFHNGDKYRVEEISEEIINLLN